jgi:hypothetical protein
MDLSSHEQRMLEFARVRLEQARARDQAHKTRLREDAALEKRQKPTPRPIQAPTAPEQTNPANTYQDTIKAVSKAIYTPSPQQKRFDVAYNRALSYLEPQRQALGAGFDLALVVVFAALSRNPNASQKASLSVMLPRWVIARGLGVSERMVDYLLTKTAAHSPALHQILTHKAWKTSLPVKTSPPVSSKPPLGESTAQQTIENRPTSRAVNGGTLFAVRLEQCRNALSLTDDDYKHPWRNLEADKHQGRTQASFAKQNPTEKRRAGRKKKIAPSLKDSKGRLQFIFSYLNSMTDSQSGLSGVYDGAISGDVANFAVWDAFEMPINSSKDGGAAWVERLADAITTATADRAGLGVWLKAAWIVVKCEILELPMARAVMYQALWDSLVGASDNPLVKNRAALARGLMNKNGWARFVEASQTMGQQAVTI